MDNQILSFTFTELIPTTERNEQGQVWKAACPHCRAEVTVQESEPTAPIYIKSQGGRVLTHIEDVGSGTTWRANNQCTHFIELTPIWFSDDDPYNNVLSVRWSTTPGSPRD
ncbi:MAG: hypothetical protein R6X18_01800 [Chloroflexota bacterium]|jgi:hypothetical protein